MTGDRHVRFCGSPGATAPGPPDFAQRVPVGARARACVHRGRQEATRSLLVCRCLKVSRSGCYAWLGREPSRTVRRRKELSALVEWVLNGSCATLRVPKGPRRRGSQRLLRRLPRGRCAPARALGARQAAATPRGPGATAPPGRWARARVPTWSGRGLPPPASRGSRWVGGIHLYTRTRGGARSAWRPPPGCCTRKAVGCATGATARGTGPWCARRSIWRPAGARTRQERRYSTRTGGASTPPSSSPSIWGDMRSTLPRAGPECAGRVPGRKSAGATLKEREGLSDGVSHKKQGHPGYCLPGRARYTQSETTPFRPGAQDAGRGPPGAPSSKTSSLKDRFQSCPRHARLPRAPGRHLSWVLQQYCC